MYRLFRFTAVVAAVMFLFGGMNIQPTLAQSGNGVTSDTSYESPTYGYEVEWTSDWSVVEDATSVTDANDALRILNASRGSWVDIWGFANDGRGIDVFLQQWTGILADNYANFDETPQDSATEGVVATIATYMLGEVQVEDYIEVREIGDAYVMTSIKAAPGFTLLAAFFVVTDIAIDGEQALPSFIGQDDAEEEETPAPDEDEETPTPDEEEEETPEEEEEEQPIQGGVDGDTYVSPTFGVFVEFDSDVWEVSDEVASEDSDNERDLLLLEAGDIPARLYLETYDSENKAGDCIDAASEEAVGDLDDAQPLEDEDGEEIAGSSRGVAYAAYSFEADDGDELAAYIECRALPGGAGVFVITMIAPETEFEAAFEELQPILDSIELEGGSASSSNSNNDDEDDSKGNSSNNNDDDEETPTPDEEEETPTPDEDEDDDTQSATGEYESPTYGFVVEYDDNWEMTDESSRSDTDTVVLESTDDIVLTIIATEAAQGDDAESCVDDYAADYDEDLLQVENADDEPIEGDDDFGFYSVKGYVDADGETQAVYLECGESPDGDYLVLFVAEVLLDDLNVVLDEVIPIIEGIQF